jgi:hypothetical protein
MIADTTKMEEWLRREQARRSWKHLAGGIALLILSIPAIIATYLVCCAVYAMGIAPLLGTFAGLNDPLGYTPVGAAVMLLLCFVGYRKANKDTLGDLSFSTGTATDTVVHVRAYVPGAGMIAGSNVNPLAPSSIRSVTKMLTGVLLIAPALGLNALNQFAKARRARAIVFPDAARVIQFLATRPHRVAYTEIAESVPGINPIRTFQDLGRVDGVLSLVTTPPGLSLNDRLRGKLDRL